MMTTYDLIVVGAGSGGIGAAITAARKGLNVLLIEKSAMLGGTAVLAGVSVWEMGTGGTGLPFEIYQRLKNIPKAIGIYSIGRHCLWPGEQEKQPFPGGESVIDPQCSYLDTLRRYGARSMREDEAFVRTHWHGVPFEPMHYARIVEEMLLETGHCTIYKNTRVIEVIAQAGRVKCLKLAEGTIITANAVIDATGDAAIARLIGAGTLLGQEPKSHFNEPDAPLKKSNHLNGATLIYRVTPRSTPSVDLLPIPINGKCWWSDQFPVASFTNFPCGDLHINMLPTMSGVEVMEMGPEQAYSECLRRVFAHWHNIQTHYKEFQRYQIQWIAPQLGLRETWRIFGEYVLTENDLLAGLSGQTHNDIITIADHAMDTHGQSTGRAGCGELREPYGIPFRCLVPKGIKNLLVACRAASFSSLASSSARLSRTMMQLGQAAGTAVALASKLGVYAAEVPPEQLQSDLRVQHVQLEHPMTDPLKTYLTETHPPV